MSNKPNTTLVDRVQRTLKRLGFSDCILRDIHDGKVTLFCPTTDRKDHSMIQVAIRTLPGISSVVFATKPELDDAS